MANNTNPSQVARSHKKRKWLRIVLISTGVLGLLAAMLMLLIQHSIARKEGPFPEHRCGATSPGTKKILVTYDSKYAATGKIAQTIAERLCSQGLTVEMLLSTNVKQVEQYRGVICGSPIYYGSWLPDVIDFLRTNETKLSTIPTAYFISCNTVGKDRNTEEKRQTAIKYYLNHVLEEFPQIVPIKPYGLFGGRMQATQQSAFERFLMGLFGYDDNDRRDWSQIERWTDEIRQSFQNQTQQQDEPQLDRDAVGIVQAAEEQKGASRKE